jgi:hypothetical protein
MNAKVFEENKLLSELDGLCKFNTIITNRRYKGHKVSTIHTSIYHQKSIEAYLLSARKYELSFYRSSSSVGQDNARLFLTVVVVVGLAVQLLDNPSKSYLLVKH